MNKISIIGAGAFGFAMANYIAQKESNISLFDTDTELIDSLKNTKRHKYHFNQVPLSDNINPTSDMKECLKGSELVILVVPSCVICKCIEQIKEFVNDNIKILNLSKGLEPETHKRISELVCEFIPNSKYGILSGGMISEDVIECKKLSASIASEDKEFLDSLYNMFESDCLSIVKSDDVIGTELCGPLKNVISIFVGILQGLDSEKEFIEKVLEEFSNEAKELAVKLGGEEETFSDVSPAWYGDLMVSCYGNSRNRTLGIELGKGGNVEAVIKKMKSENKIVEGYSNTKIFYEISNKLNFDCKYFSLIYDILYGNKNVKEIVSELR